VEQLRAQAPQEYVPAAFIALVCVAQRKSDEAFEWLEKASDDHSILMPMLKVGCAARSGTPRSEVRRPGKKVFPCGRVPRFGGFGKVPCGRQLELAVGRGGARSLLGSQLTWAVGLFQLPRHGPCDRDLPRPPGGRRG